MKCADCEEERELVHVHMGRRLCLGCVQDLIATGDIEEATEDDDEEADG